MDTPKKISIGAMLSAFAFLLFMQTQMKSMPQLVMMGLGLATYLSLVKFEKTGRILFFVLFGTALTAAGFILTNLLLDLVIPERGYAIDHTTGEKHGVMDFSVFLGVPVGIGLALLTLWLYKKNIKQNKKMETACTLLYTLATAIIYFLLEVL